MPTLYPSFVTNAAAILATRRRNGERGPRLSELSALSENFRLDVDTALAIQAAVAEQLGERIDGWKCGMPVKNGPVIAPIHASTISIDNPCSARPLADHVRVEPELAFIIGHDLPMREHPYTPEEVDAAIVRTHLALELIDSRYSDPAEAAFTDNLADGLLNQGLFIGPQVDNELASSTGKLALHVTFSENQELHLEGRHPSALPRAPLHWLAEFLRARGESLRAGQVVITGSYAGSFDLPVGQDIAIRYGDLGLLKVHFASR